MRSRLGVLSLAIGLLLGPVSPARAALLTLSDSSLSIILPWIDTSCNDPWLCCDPAFDICTPRSNELVFPQRLASVP